MYTACISASTQHIILWACVENYRTMTAVLHYVLRSWFKKKKLTFFVKLCVQQSWVLAVAVFGNAALLAGPDAGDLFPHQWMVQAESQWAGWPTFQLSKYVQAMCAAHHTALGRYLDSLTSRCQLLVAKGSDDSVACQPLTSYPRASRVSLKIICCTFYIGCRYCLTITALELLLVLQTRLNPSKANLKIKKWLWRFTGTEMITL